MIGHWQCANSEGLDSFKWTCSQSFLSKSFYVPWGEAEINVSGSFRNRTTISAQSGYLNLYIFYLFLSCSFNHLILEKNITSSVVKKSIGLKVDLQSDTFPALPSNLLTIEKRLCVGHSKALTLLSLGTFVFYLVVCLGLLTP